ncbi:MAG: hypothetical protein H0U59_12970 [Gemmatimonadaceae bacterium]|nr:hypothetical protein [Gemmatimonadaceae bacterium]
MFIGHFAVAFAGKKVAPNAPLPALLLGALFADVLWPILVAIGAEHVRIVPGATVYTPLEFVSYPWSHSLLMLIIWGGLFAAYYRGRTDGRLTGWVVGALVVSHWILDWITHRPDMPLWPGGPKYGLNLWNNVNATIAVEIAMFVAGVLLYATATRARDAVGRWGLWSLAALLLATFVFDSFDRAPPPSIKALWITALIATAVVVSWAGWVDRHRETA